MSTAIRSGFATKAVGVTFVDGYPDNLTCLAEADRRAHAAGEPLAAVLIRNPANPHDPNAVEVHVPEVGMVGHLPAAVAQRLAPQMDAGERWRASVEQVRVDPAHPERPGISIQVEPVRGDR